MNKLLIFGGGYTAQTLIKSVAQLFERILYTTRSPREQDALVFDGTLSLDFNFIKDSTHILVTIPPVGDKDIVVKTHFEILKELPSLKWVGYLSTTGVYGDYNGAWVDENSPLLCSHSRSKTRSQIEQQWLELYHTYNIPIHIFRLAGIYGPGRSALDSLRSGTAKPIRKEGHVFSRIHVEDIAQVIKASMTSPQAGTIYNVTDDLPSSNLEVLKYAAQLLKMPLPPILDFEEAPMSDMLREFYSECRRVQNQRIKQDLKVKLLYPTYKEGLDAIWRLQTA